MISHQPQDWQVGEWTVRSRLNRIEGPGGPLHAAPKVLATLICLAEHQGDVVSRETMLDTIWAGTIVSDDTINRAISDLRRLLGDSSQESRVIETIRQRGYRLLLPAHPLAPEAGGPFASRDPAVRRSRPGVRLLGTVSLGLLITVLGFTITRQQTSIQVTQAYRAVPLTTSPGFEFDVAISHDGEKVAYTAYGAEGGQMDLFVKQIGVETAQKITDDARIEISPGWSPDGRALAFLAGDRPLGPCGVYVMRLPGGDARKMAECQTLLVTGVSWSPDGTTIAFSDRTGRDKPFRIYLLDLETHQVTPVTDPPEGHFGDFSATFSPDGERLGFIRGTVAGTTALILAPALGDIHTIELASRAETRLTFDNQEIPHLDWMPDGRDLVFASRRLRGTQGLWRVASTGGSPRWVLGSKAFTRKPTLARHRDRMVYEEWSTDVSIWQTPFDALMDSTESAAPLIRSTHFDATPQYSPDGTRLAFTSQRSGASEIWISQADGRHPLQITTFGGPFTSSPRWSPDGAHLAFETRTNGQSDIYVVDITGGAARRLTQDPAQDMVPSWAPDGSSIYFGSDRGGVWQVWQMPSAGGEARPVTTQGGFLALAAPTADHPMLYYTRINMPGLFRVPLAGGAETLVLDDLLDDDWGNWLATETGLLYFRRASSTLVHFDYATGRTTERGHLDHLPFGMIGLTVTPDGSMLAYVQQRHDNADLWIVDGFR